ncbi:glycosyltransferase [Carnobacterium funditum]|uniref:glycosyltransferase n=1 Tax=Carnobacterium funditum TaxID=2752 RepID=UPI00055602F9|nr:glycosyltransferase [Carnobacterium funditum]
MNANHIFLISPPFYSHFTPLLVLAKSFKKLGKEVTFGCSNEFKEQVEQGNLTFYEIDISKNKNVGKAKITNQPDSEKDRLDEFFEATRKGAVETLITQSKHREKDMLYKPEELISKIEKIDKSLAVDLYVVDILSYGVTLGLYSLNLPFVTFCPPHPRTIPMENENYGVPKNWPSAIPVENKQLEELKQVSKKTQNEFTSIFNKMIEESTSNCKKIENAFSLVSEKAILYNYFDFDSIEDKQQLPNRIFMGNCFEGKSLDKEWLEKIKGTNSKILITLGTFLSNRVDVLEKLIVGCEKYNPGSLLIVSAGDNAEKLKQYRSSSVIIEAFIPQKALMPYMDNVIFHGGCNTFTEAMYYGKPMIILPFSSDQFNIAYDCEKKELAEILNPNTFEEKELLTALEKINNQSKRKLTHWSDISKKRGPDYAVKQLLDSH